MKYILKKVALFFCIIFFLTSPAFAAWRGPANVTKENQKKYGISIEVSEDDKSNKYIVEIKRFRDKCCWLFPKGEPSEGFSNVIYSPEKRFAEYRIQFKKSEKSIYLLDKLSIQNAFVLFDHCRAVKDGGYYYVIDLSTYIE